MRFKNFFQRRLARAAFLLFLAFNPSLRAQTSQVLAVKPSAKLVAVRNAPLTAKLTVQVSNGYHVNSNAPADEYLIPLKLTWDESALKAVETAYPKPELVNYSFSPKPLSVYSGQFDIVTRFQVPSGAALGPSVLVGKLRYQACNDSMCLPPKVVQVKLLIDIRTQ